MATLALFGHYNVSITDATCTWSTQKRSKGDSVKKIKDIYPTKEHRSTKRDATTDEVEDLCQKLQSFDGAVGFTWLLHGEVNVNTEEKIIVNVEDIIFNEEFIGCKDRASYFKNKVKVSRDVIFKIVEETVGQSNNDNWLICRKHRITASNFGVVLSACRRNRFPPSLFKRLLGKFKAAFCEWAAYGRTNGRKRCNYVYAMTQRETTNWSDHSLNST